MNVNETILATNQRRLLESKRISASIEEQQQDRAFAETVSLQPETPENQSTSVGSTIINKAFTFSKVNSQVVDNLLVTLNVTNYPDYEYLFENNKEEFQQKLNLLVCANQSTLSKVVFTRNAIAEETTKIANYYKVVDATITNISNILASQVELVKVLDATKFVASQAVKLIPSPPGTPGVTTALISDVDSLIRMIMYTSTGAPKLETIKQSIVLAQLSFQQVTQILNVFLKKLTFLDTVLEKCGQQIKPVNETFKTLATIYKPSKVDSDYSEPYKGFTLVIETKPVQNTQLSQKRAVAFTPSGIPVISTAYSYTTKPVILFEQLKFTITSQNLKAN